MTNNNLSYTVPALEEKPLLAVDGKCIYEFETTELARKAGIRKFCVNGETVEFDTKAPSTFPKLILTSLEYGAIVKFYESDKIVYEILTKPAVIGKGNYRRNIFDDDEDYITDNEEEFFRVMSNRGACTINTPELSIHEKFLKTRKYFKTTGDNTLEYDNGEMQRIALSEKEADFILNLFHGLTIEEYLAEEAK